jgi:HupE / UreJ protein
MAGSLVRKSFALFVLCLLGGLAASPSVQAHAQSTSFLILDAEPSGPVPVRWDLSVHDLIWSVFIDADYDGLATWQEIQDARASIENAALAQLSVTRGGAVCSLRVDDLALANRSEQNHVSLAMTAECPRPGVLSISGSLFMTGDASQRVLLSAQRGNETLTGVLSAAAPVWSEPQSVSDWDSFALFIGQGVWHVLIGYDHIAFVLLLLLPSVMRPVNGKWEGATAIGQVTRDILMIVTAFTIAHSTTLALAVTRTVVLPIQPVELAIAASIAVAGLLNLLPRLSGWRLPLAFAFGLVHGFGFANAMSELDTGGSSLLPLLAGFNIGVELAQLGIVALVLPLIYVARRTRWYAGGVLPLGSCALGAAGVVWLIQRI